MVYPAVHQLQQQLQTLEVLVLVVMEDYTPQEDVVTHLLLLPHKVIMEEQDKIVVLINTLEVVEEELVELAETRLHLPQEVVLVELEQLLVLQQPLQQELAVVEVELDVIREILRLHLLAAELVEQDVDQYNQALMEQLIKVVVQAELVALIQMVELVAQE